MKKLIQISCLSLFMLAPVWSKAKENFENKLTISVADLATITGIITNSDGLGIAYASVELLTPEGELVDGTLTAEDGSFKLENKNYGDYILRVTVAGMEPHEEDIHLDESTFDLGEIMLLSESVALDDMTVRAETTKIKTEIDKRVIEIGKDLVSAGATAVEVLNNIPSLQVDQQSGQLTLRGNSNVRVFVDGKPSSIPVDQLLKQLPSNSIAKVEIITNPSAKYEPDGNSGIINIITNKEKRKGYNVGTNLGYTRGAKNRYNGSINGNFNTGKFNFFGTFSGGFGESDFEAFTQNETLDIGQYLRLPSEFDNQLYKIGMDWFINDKTALTVYTNQNLGGSKMNMHSYNTYSNSRDFYDLSVYDNDFNSSDYSLNMTRDLEKEGHKLEFDAFYSKSNNDGNSDFDWQSAYYNVENNDLGELMRYYNQQDEREINTVRLKLDHTLPVWEKGKIESGLNFNQENTENSLFTNQYLPESYSQVVTNALQAQDTYFDFKRSIFAAYLNLGYQWEKWGMQLGLRAETVNEDIDTQLFGSEDIADDQFQFTRDQVNFYPSAFFTYQATENYQFSINYSRRVDRPGVWALSPIRNWQSPTIRQEGNPELKPQFTDSYELGYMRKLGQKGNLNASVFYRKIHDEMSQFIYTDEINPNIIILKRANVEGTQSYGAEVSWYYKANNWWSNNGGIDFYFNELNSLLPDNQRYTVNNQQLNLRMSNDFKLSKTWKLQLFTMYRGKEKFLQGEQGDMFRQDIGVSKTFAGGKGTITARMSDILDTFYADIYLDNPYITTGEMHWESRTFYLGLNYNFGGKVKTRADKQQNRGESGGNTGGIGF